MNENDITLEIINKTYDEYENEKYNMIKVAKELSNYIGHTDVIISGDVSSNIINNRKAKAKLKRLADERKDFLKKELKITQGEN